MFLDVPFMLMGMIQRSRADVGALVRHRMKERGLTQVALRKKSGVDPKTLKALLNGDRWPQEETRSRIEISLGWEFGSIQDLLDGREATVIRPAGMTPVVERESPDLISEDGVRELPSAVLLDGMEIFARELRRRASPRADPGKDQL